MTCISIYTAGYAPIGFVRPPFVPFPQPGVTKLKPIHVKTTVSFPNGFTRVFYPNRGSGFVPYGGPPSPPIVPFFPMASGMIRPAPTFTNVIPIAPKIPKQETPKPEPVTPIIEKPETLKPIEQIEKPGEVFEILSIKKNYYTRPAGIFFKISITYIKIWMKKQSFHDIKKNTHS